jgi:hypothetical protein
LSAARTEPIHSDGARLAARLVEEARLADAGWSLNQDDASASVAGTTQRSPELREFALAFQQRSSGRCAIHDRKPFGQLFGWPPLRLDNPANDDRAVDKTPATAKATLELELEVGSPESDDSPPAGHLITRDGERRAFLGWLELASFIEDWRQAQQRALNAIDRSTTT